MAEEFQPKKDKKEKKGRKKKKVVVEEEEDDDLGAKWTVDAFHAGNFTRYFNHSCNPNLRLEPVFYNDYDPEKPFLAFFSRRLIKKGEELCFAYHGGIDDEELSEDEVQTRPPGQLRDGASKTPKKKGAASVAIVADEGVVIENYEQECKCGARNCKKSMFKLSAGLSLEDDASDSETDSSEYETDEEEEVGMVLGLGEGGSGGEIGKGGGGGELMMIDEE
ncbi:hypothetical protein BDY24DRAFT_172562 [Mrakia frigida]|uniref:uncharacterized protein n=1 Tax=Mrakia frigida TaxID=29902 RepID=UPI003FCC046E